MFEVGDKVYLREDSEWNDGTDDNPINVTGTIVEFTPDDVLDYSVMWANGIRNGYDAKDLVLVSDLKIDPLVTIPQSEYDDLIEEINMLQELVSELYKQKELETFKPISEYTIDDWKQARDEEWVFKTEHQGLVFVNDIENDVVQLSGGERGTWWIDADGRDTDGEGYTVLERIK